MSSVFGEKIKISVFGQSHSEAVGVVIDGFPAGFRVDTAALDAFMKRRAPSGSFASTSRREEDKPVFLSGLVDGVTCGAPISVVIRNNDARSSDYDKLKTTPRPGHADLTARLRYGESADLRGGGHLSGRLTAPLCAAGGLCLQWLGARGVTVKARIVSVHGNTRDPEEEIGNASRRGDSVGGVIECVISGLRGGLGDPMFDGIENVISRAVFAVPAVKGIEFGDGFALASLYGSEANDAFRYEDGKVVTKTNHAGGILGGITTGSDVVFRVAVKPTPSVSVVQETVDLAKKENTTLSVTGRHDVSVVPRAVPCIEAAAALAVTDMMMKDGTEWN